MYTSNLIDKVTKKKKSCRNESERKQSSSPISGYCMYKARYVTVLKKNDMKREKIWG